MSLGLVTHTRTHAEGMKLNTVPFLEEITLLKPAALSLFPFLSFLPFFLFIYLSLGCILGCAWIPGSSSSSSSSSCADVKTALPHIHAHPPLPRVVFAFQAASEAVQTSSAPGNVTLHSTPGQSICKYHQKNCSWNRLYKFSKKASLSGLD